MKAVLKTTGLENFDAVVPNEIGGLNAFEAILAGHRFGKSALDTDLVARAYPMIYQTVRCLNNISITPSAVADGAGREEASLTSPAAILNIKCDPGIPTKARRPYYRRSHAKCSCTPWLARRNVHQPNLRSRSEVFTT